MGRFSRPGSAPTGRNFSSRARKGKRKRGWIFFGARYYANGQYMFISVDPIVNREGAITNPQLWNLYSYCRNSPITYLDPDGSSEVEINVARTALSAIATLGTLSVSGADITGFTLEPPWKDNLKDQSCIKCGKYEASMEKWAHDPSVDILRLQDRNGREGAKMHPGNEPAETTGCILPGSKAVGNNWVSGSRAKLKEITDFIRMVQVFDYFITKEPTIIKVNVYIDSKLAQSILGGARVY